jgi:ATP-dependent DNA ligase
MPEVGDQRCAFSDLWISDIRSLLLAIADALALDRRARIDHDPADGKAVVGGPNGLTDFEALRRRGSGDVAVLYAFDLLEYDGSDLRRMPLETRLQHWRRC